MAIFFYLASVGTAQTMGSSVGLPGFVANILGIDTVVALYKFPLLCPHFCDL